MDLSKLIRLFKKVQKIPYQVCPFDSNKINKNLPYGDCRHKSYLLFLLLKKEGFRVKQLKVLFDWKDLPLPKNLIALLKKSDTLWPHDALAVKIKNKWIKIDCTWNPELKFFGFPVTEQWNGTTDTLQVTTGKLKFFDINKLNKKPFIVKKEAHLFAEKLNTYLNRSRFKNTK